MGIDIEQIKRMKKKALGKFKDELKGLTLKEFIGLRPKCYSLLYQLANLTEEEEKQIAKSVKKSVKKASLRHASYKDTLENLTTYFVKQNTIKSKAHQIGSYHQTKVALTAFDKKRWICDNGVDTKAFGYRVSCIIFSSFFFFLIYSTMT